MTRHIAVKAAPATTGNGLRGSDSSGQKIPNAHTEKVSQHQLAPARWRDVLPVHPAAELFPLMSKAELRELTDDIKKNGLREPAHTLIDDKGNHSLLDGRNRLDALELSGEIIFDGSNKWQHGRWPEGSNNKFFDEVNLSDPFAYVISANIHRRHLTPEQKRD